MMKRSLSVISYVCLALVEDETPPNNADEKSKGQNPENTILKRSKSAMSSKFKVVKKMKRDRAMRKTLPSTLTEVFIVTFI